MKLYEILGHPLVYYLGTDLILKLRPDGCLSRSESILLARDPADLAPFVGGGENPRLNGAFGLR
jgi:hypothetical protein